MSANIQRVFTLLERSNEYSRVGEVLALWCGQQESERVSLIANLGIVGLLRRLHVTPLSRCKRDFVQTSRGEREPASQSRGDSVCKFKSGHTSTAGSTGALVQLSTATAGKVEKGPNFMSSNGSAPQPIPVSEIYDEVYLK